MTSKRRVRHSHHLDEEHLRIERFVEFQIDLPGIENYGFEGESSFMKCKFGAVASDSEEASKVGR